VSSVFFFFPKRLALLPDDVGVTSPASIDVGDGGGGGGGGNGEMAAAAVVVVVV
jgi:hypothetical protein